MLDTHQNTKIICLTPVKNEAWILETFLKCASLWADQIIIADQMSTDGSREIAKKYPKVTLIDNHSEAFNEPERQKLLINQARLVECDRRILIALDADEVLVGDIACFVQNKLNEIARGSVLTFDWLNVNSNRRDYWKSKCKMPFGFIDDGSEHCGELIHSTRVPAPKAARFFHMQTLQVLHLQYIDWDRMQSKHRWYQCFERINYPSKSAIDIFRMYHHMYSYKKNIPILASSLSFYHEHGINPLQFTKLSEYHWDTEVMKLIKIHGAKYFRRIDLWNCNSSSGKSNPNLGISPNGTFDRALLKYLAATQYFYPNILLKIADKAIKIITCVFGVS